MFKAEYLEHRNLYWCTGLLLPGVARSNNGMESRFKYFKTEACPEVRQERDFLLSIENTIRTTSLAINEDYVKNVMYYDADMEHNRKVWTRDIYRKALNEEFNFTEILGTNGDEVVVPAKKIQDS